MGDGVSLTIRRILPDDRAQWLHLWECYNAFYGRSDDTALPDEITEATWDRFFDPADPVDALVGCDSGELVGIAHYLFHASTTALSDVCYLQDLYTRDDWRGRGVGKALIEAISSEAQARGASRLYWQTHQTNHVARRLYDKMASDSGFIVYRMMLP